MYSSLKPSRHNGTRRKPTRSEKSTLTQLRKSVQNRRTDNKLKTRGVADTEDELKKMYVPPEVHTDYQNRIKIRKIHELTSNNFRPYSPHTAAQLIQNYEKRDIKLRTQSVLGILREQE